MEQFAPTAQWQCPALFDSAFHCLANKISFQNR
jgi:hypothetical protein